MKLTNTKLIRLGVTSALLCSVSIAYAGYLCYVIQDGGKCGTELSPTPPSCVKVECDSKQDCPAISYEISGKDDCMGRPCGCSCYIGTVSGTTCVGPWPTWWPTPTGFGGTNTTHWAPYTAKDCTQ